MMLIDNKFNIGETAYLKTDTEQKERIVTAFQVLPSLILYRLSCGEGDGWFYDIEISTEKNILVE